LYEKMHENNMQIDIEDGNLIEETDEDNEGC
jgi:hypothetical protein